MNKKSLTRHDRNNILLSEVRLLGGIGRHNRLKICRPKGLPVRVRQQVPESGLIYIWFEAL